MAQKDSTTGEDADAMRRRRRSSTVIKESLRELSVLRLPRSDQAVRSDQPERPGPADRTARGNHDRHPRPSRTWRVDRPRDRVDRRAVVLRATRERNPELFRLYADINTSMDRLLVGYSVDELDVLVDFLRRTLDAGRVATDQLSAQ
jgi:hypothetical protein